MTSSSSSAALRAASWSSSMAPSTACSASLLQGVWRPVKSDARSVDETAGDADVIPGWFLPVWVPEQGGRMVGNDNRDAPEPVDLIAQRAERLLRVEERLRRRPPIAEITFGFTVSILRDRDGTEGGVSADLGRG